MYVNGFQFILTFFLLSLNLCGYSQLESDKWYTLHYDFNTSLKVEVQFQIVPNGCQNGMATMFLYRYSGPIGHSEEYINWKLNYIDCDNQAYCFEHGAQIGGQVLLSKVGNNPEDQVIEMFDDQITQKSFVGELYGESRSSVIAKGKTNIVIDNSINPAGISGSSKIKYGEEIVLSLMGGTLGKAAKWVWHENGCDGTVVGNGREIVVKPLKNTNYFVRSESSSGKTPCISKNISVDMSSTMPDGIQSDDEICQGSSVKLVVEGGQLGPNGAKWVWYKTNCGGGNSIGSGVSFSVEPLATAQYYVRAEGPGTLLTGCVSKRIEVFEKPNSPVGLEVLGSDAFCEGKEVVLKVEGELPIGSEWVWSVEPHQILRKMENAQRVSTLPKENSTFQVYGSSEVCGNTEALTKEVFVFKKSKSPSSIKNETSTEGKLQLVIKDGKLGTDAKWIWERQITDNKGNVKGQVISGENDEVLIPKFPNTTYIVYADGKCGKTESKSTSVEELKVKKSKTSSNWSSNYYNTNQRFHFGFEIGADYHQFPSTLIEQSGLGFPDIDHVIKGNGVFGGIHIHPVMNEYFSWGIRAGMAYGVENLLYMETGWTSGDSTFVENYSYARPSFGTEMLIGIANYGKVKLLLDWQRSSMSNNFLLEVSNTNSSSLLNSYAYTNDLTFEKICFGFRFGSYSRINTPDKNGFNFDLFGSLSHVSDLGLMDFKNTDRNLSQWYFGLGMGIWAHGAIRTFFEATAPLTMNRLSGGLDNFGDTYYQFSFTYSFDIFH
jgi:hypothetical protein